MASHIGSHSWNTGLELHLVFDLDRRHLQVLAVRLTFDMRQKAESDSDRELGALTPPLDTDNPPEMLTRMAVGYLKVLTSPDGIALYRAMVAGAPHFPELAANFFENGPGRATQHLADFLRLQKQRGKLAVGDATRDAAQFLGAVRGDLHLIAVLNARPPSKRQVDTAAKAAVETYCAGRA